jgi:hypothetical protein
MELKFADAKHTPSHYYIPVLFEDSLLLSDRHCACCPLVNANNVSLAPGVDF